MQAYRFVLAVPAETTLEELASDILDVAEFDGDHLISFYLASSSNGKPTWLTADGEWDNDADVPDVRLSEIFPLPRNKKLYFEYDPGASWRFEIVRQGKEKDAEAGQTYPTLILEEGVRPDEYGPDDD